MKAFLFVTGKGLSNVLYLMYYTVPCSCVALTEKLTCYRNELEKLNKQVLNLVKQKLDLAQQLEMWEVHNKKTQLYIVTILNMLLSREMWSVWLVTMFFSS